MALYDFNIASSPSIGHLAGQLSRYAGDIRSTKEAMERSIRDVVIPRIEENIDTQGGDGDEKWDDIRPATRFFPYRRKRGAQDNPLLQVTGNLKRSATALARWQFDGQGGVAFIPASKLPPTRYYMFYQHEGASRTGLVDSPVPARPFFYIHVPEDVDRMEEIFQRWGNERFEANVS